MQLVAPQVAPLVSIPMQQMVPQTTEYAQPQVPGGVMKLACHNCKKHFGVPVAMLGVKGGVPRVGVPLSNEMLRRRPSAVKPPRSSPAPPGLMLRPRDGGRVVLYLKDINLPKPDKYETAELVAFLQQLVTYKVRRPAISHL